MCVHYVGPFWDSQIGISIFGGSHSIQSLRIGWSGKAIWRRSTSSRSRGIWAMDQRRRIYVRFLLSIASSCLISTLTKIITGKPKGVINPRWLNDENGKQVTPTVEGQKVAQEREMRNPSAR